MKRILAVGERTYALITADPLHRPTPEQQQAALDFFKIVSPLPNANGDYCCYVSVSQLWKS